MANNYFSKQDPTDFSMQSEDGGGILLTKNGKYIFGAKQEDVTKQLNEEGYDGNVDVNPNNNSSFIGIMNQNSVPLEVDIPNTNQYSLFEPQQTNIIQSNQNSQVDCANEFDDIANAILKTSALYYPDFDIPNNSINQPVVTDISKINSAKLKKAKDIFLNYFWNSNTSKRFKESLPNGVEPFIIPNPDKFIIKNLPPGLRGLFVGYIFSTNSTPYYAFPLVFGPDGINLKDESGNSLGVPFEKSNHQTLIPEYTDRGVTLIADNDGNLTNEEIYLSFAKNVPPGAKQNAGRVKTTEIYVKNFNKYIEYYNTSEINKKQVLEIWKKVLTRSINNTYNTKKKKYTKKEFDDGNYEEWRKYNIDILNKIYDIALKYINCPPPTVTTTTPSTATTAPSTTTPTSTTPPSSLTPQEIEEGIYEANFLPASENEGFQISEFIDVTNNNNESLTNNDVDEINKQENEARLKEGKPPLPKEKENKKTGTVKSLIQNDTVQYGNLGDLIYYPTPLFAQGDPEWGSYQSTHAKKENGKTVTSTLSMAKYGCAYNTAAMLLGNSIKDANKTTPYALWNSGVKNTNSVLVFWPSLASVVGKTIILSGENQTMDNIDKILKTKPVGFEWRGGNDYPIGWGWSKGYNNYRGVKKGSYKGVSKGDSYTCCNQHWMVITGKNKDGTYTIFDPAGGVIRKNQPADNIQAGLNRIIYVK